SIARSNLSCSRATSDSRPWNDAIDDAHLQVVRGGASFLAECAAALVDLGASGVLSPPLPTAAQQLWKQAAFTPYVSLRLLRRSLDAVPPPDHAIGEGSHADLEEALRIDTAAFDGFWRFDRTALLEALNSTRISKLHLIRNPQGGLAGFAITGVGSAHAYLQRVAVDPPWQGRGLGRSLVRISARWAKQQGARTTLLNTQTDNLSAIHLYESEGYTALREPLEVLRR
ncbi:MAG: GNAT family N-acetyltransferase, partial [Acidimicrobiia bacterium]